MKPTRTCLALAAVLLFLALPLALYALAPVPGRSLLKEALSILTVLSFTLLLGQFFLARTIPAVQQAFKVPHLQALHRWIGYGAITVLLLHPFLIVLPRYFEPGVRPLDALITMLTNFDNLGVLLGLVSWGLMLVLALTSHLRMRLIKRFHIRYRVWRGFHAVLATGFTGLSLWHAIELGRHTGWLLGGFFGLLALAGIALLARLYMPERPRPAAHAEGLHI
ncbi:ferric reductase-like transmembrane domain-containing protein [Tropicimonas sp. TH_r6]|uniref:ferric reductase-like transmembrane domain-containing protein n=1 Tax=Tropicimonas sp. TH_r6 TaxID=3082085 RepID=UPI0029535A36|nr:ferric reductase-like transmembrane domain-containing protein [Tropicimonas sp. TH_r6]MDV7145384.1 ferric reductase-like transmembrane domain-containing protein [Tropicimonas sp. TH_r6]